MGDFRYRKSIVDYLRVAVVPGQYEWTLFPADERHEARTGGRPKPPGPVSGRPDIVGVLAGGRLACLEIRRPGGPSTRSPGPPPARQVAPTRAEFADRIRAMGARYEVVATVDNVRAVRARWRVGTRDVRAEYGVAVPGRGRAA